MNEGSDRRSFLKNTALAGAGIALSLKSDTLKENGVEEPRTLVHTEKVGTPVGTIEIADVAAEQVTEKRPILIAPAWACTIPVYAPAMKVLAKEGRRTLSLNHPRIENEIVLSNEQKKVVGQFPIEEIRKAFNILAVLDAKDIKDGERIDVVAHSEGVINVTIAALLHPEKFRNVVFFGPAGLAGEDNATRLLFGWTQNFVKSKPTMKAGTEWDPPMTEVDRDRARARGQTIPEYKAIEDTDSTREVLRVVGTEGLDYILDNKSLAVKEGSQMAKAQIIDALRTLRGHGISITIMSGVDDPVFPTERIGKTISAVKIDADEDIRNVVNGFVSVRGGHGEIAEHPEQFMVAAELLLKQMEKNREKKF